MSRLNRFGIQVSKFVKIVVLQSIFYSLNLILHSIADKSVFVCNFKDNKEAVMNWKYHKKNR